MIWPSDKGEWLLRDNFALVSPLIVYSFSSVSENSITMKKGEEKVINTMDFLPKSTMQKTVQNIMQNHFYYPNPARPIQ